MAKKLYPKSGPTPLQTCRLYINSPADFGYKQKVNGESPEDAPGLTVETKGMSVQLSIHKIKTNRHNENYTKHIAVTWLTQDQALQLAQELLKSIEGESNCEHSTRHSEKNLRVDD